ncbi:MAG: universal stress protein [Pirellulales bacterium]|nr:universal stress protein [Pirellulales bacterium]
MIKIEKILLPTDFSECSEQARSYASELARRFDAEIHLLHVVSSAPPPVYAGPVPAAVLQPEEDAKKVLEDWDDPAFKDAKSVVRNVAMGSPFVEIVRYAREQNINLIVMGTHGRSGLVQVLLGSTAEKVVRKAACPVLTVRPEGQQFVMP